MDVAGKVPGPEHGIELDRVKVDDVVGVPGLL